MNLRRVPTLLLCLGVVPLAFACGDDGSDAADTGSASAGDDAASTGTAGDDGGSMSSSPATPGTNGSDDTTTLATEGSSSDGPSDTEGPPETCADWTAPPLQCEVRGDATAQVTGDFLPEMEDAACTVVSVEATSAVSDAVTLDCGETHTLQITSESPHLVLPLSAEQDVRVTAAPLFDFALDEKVPSFVIRSPDGDILVAYVHVRGDDVEPNVDIAPLTIEVAPSGCGTSSYAKLCDEPGATIALQRSILQFGGPERPISLFDRNQGIVPAGAVELSVIAESVERIVCWDDACGGDESGPFDRIELLAVALPEA